MKLTDEVDPGEVSTIPTTRNLWALVDRKHERRLLHYRWYANIVGGGHVYAVADVDGKRVSLQRLIKHLMDESVPLQDVKQVSFVNKFSLDCRESNLLMQTGRRSVMRNRRGKRTSASHYKGVRRRERQSGAVRWSASIRLEEGTLSLGTYETETYAAEVYDAAAYLFFEGSGFLNFPEQPPNLSALEDVRVRLARYRARKANRDQQSGGDQEGNSRA